MDIPTSLAKLQCSPTSTLDEIKAQYRKLSKLVHPDLNPTRDASAFIILQQSYDFLLKYHKPIVVPPKPEGHVENYYRFIDPARTNINTTLEAPTVLEHDSYIYFMQGASEFRVLLKKGTVLPTTISVTNLNRPLTIHITNHIDKKV